MKFINNVDYRDCVGKVFQTRNFGEFEVIDYKSSRHVDVKFLTTGFTKTCNLKEVRNGSIKDETLPIIYGKGFVGTKYKTYFKSDNGKKVNTKEYEAWRGMLRRCYSTKEYGKFSSYVDCEVSDNFRSYEYFYEWCNKQVGFDKNFDLDKDLLVKRNRIYHEDLCVFVPREINSLFTKSDKIRGKYPIGVYFCNKRKKFIAQINRNKGKQDYLGQFNSAEDAFLAYKVAKEDFIKEVAENWKGIVDNRVYNALMNYEVEITD